MNIKQTLGGDGTAVISVKSKGGSITVIAPACARAVGLHINGIRTAYGNESVLIGNSSVIDSKGQLSVIGVVVGSAVLIGEEDGSATRIAGRFEATVKQTALVCNIKSLGKLSIRHLRLKIVAVIGAGTSDSGEKVNREVVVNLA